MTTAYTSLLGLALPVTGELSGTWGDTVNNSITSLLDSAIAGTTTLSSDADVTLTTTTGASNTSRQAILLWTAGGTVTRNITAPAQSKIYTVINKSSSTQSIVLRGVGPTTGVTIVKGESAVCAWNGSDFIKISNTSGAGVFTTVTASSLTSGRVTYATTAGLLTDSANLLYSGTDLTVYGLTVGRGAGAVATNTAFGASALAVNSSGTRNVALGSSALAANTSGSYSTAVGFEALSVSTTGTNSAFGYQVLRQVTTGSFNVGLGGTDGSIGSTAELVTTGNYNVAIGMGALRANTTGSSNVAIGNQALITVSTASNNVAIGQQAAFLNNQSNITAVGFQALYNNTNTLNTAVGYRALTTNTSGQAVTAVGYEALRDNSTGSRNTAVGYGTLANNNTGENNSAVGQTALGSNTTGTDNSALGYDALATNTSGAYNTALGKDALNKNTTASNNTAVGYQALYTLTTGNGVNTAVGNLAGYATQGGAENNNYFGNSAGSTVTTGNGNVCLGHFAGTNTHTVFHITTQSDRVVVGNSLTTNAYVQVAWTVTSDARDKADVVSSTYGLDFVNKLKPVTFKWDKRSSYALDNIAPDGSKKQSKTQLGFLAQDVIELEKEFGAVEKDLLIADDEQEESLKITETKMIPVLVKAIQELKAEFDAYKASHP
jgi:hypothetical protein